jgi:hypothetical protein
MIPELNKITYGKKKDKIKYRKKEKGLWWSGIYL